MSNFFIRTKDCRYGRVDDIKTTVSLVYTNNNITKTILTNIDTTASIEEVHNNEELYIDMLLSKIKEDLMKQDKL